jgi:hypothetical protein
VEGGVYLLHPALDAPVSISRERRPPLTEGTMPEAWLRLDELAQERALLAVWERAIAWAMARGVDAVRVDAVMATAAERADYAARADRIDGGWTVHLGRANAETILREAFPKPVELQALAGTTTVLEVYETWDGILAHSGDVPEIDTRT